MPFLFGIWPFYCPKHWSASQLVNSICVNRGSFIWAGLALLSLWYSGPVARCSRHEFVGGRGCISRLAVFGCRNVFSVVAARRYGARLLRSRSGYCYFNFVGPFARGAG